MSAIPDSPNLDRRAIGRRIRCLIQDQYRTVSRFARKAGFSQTTLYKILSGEVMPSPRTLSRLCRQLGCSVDFLLGICSPESDPNEGYEAALINIQAFRDSWTRSQQLFLVFALLGRLTESEERKMRLRLGLEKQEPPDPAP